MRDLLDRHRVIVCVGSGGVGKTTTAAALALRAAIDGKRVLCLTIDPAKRLANSLGLTAMTTEDQEVGPELFAAQGLQCGGSLAAMMLDTKRTFDELVARHASSDEVRRRILANKLYQYVSTSLSGTQEYMAMEKLHSVRNDPSWDLIVLDTPPTSNALDFLDAPERLVGAIDSAAMRWFIQAFEGAGKLSLGLVSKGAAFMLRTLSKFTGGEFLAHVAELVTDLNDLFGGFRQRANEVERALRSPEVAFVVVTSPDPLAMSEAVFFAQRLHSSEMNAAAFVVNGVHELLHEPKASKEQLLSSLIEAVPEVQDPKRLLHRMQRALDDERNRAVADRIHADRLRMQIGDEKVFLEVPAFERDVHDLAALDKIGQILVGPRIQGA